MKNILMVAPFESNGRFNGGISSYANSIINAHFFEQHGFSIRPLNSSRVKRSPFSGGHFRLENVVNFFRTKKSIKKELKNGKYELLYVNTSRRNALLKDLFLAQKKKKRGALVLFHIHFADVTQVFPSNKFARAIAIHRLKKVSDAIVVLSSALKDELNALGFDSRKIYLLRNFFDPKLLGKKPLGKAVGAFGAKRPITFLFVGSITDRKGIYELLKVFADLDISYHLLVCGTPNEADGAAAIQKYSSQPNVSFLGFVEGEAKHRAFSEADVFVLPTKAEGLPISILEAMRYSLPIISTRVGAIPEIVDSDFGFVIDPGDQERLKECICFYHDFPQMLKEHSVKSFEASKLYSFDAFCGKMLGIFQSLLPN
jgi:glycosyltransferase involved in cell wall biosynthesis